MCQLSTVTAGHHKKPRRSSVAGSGSHALRGNCPEHEYGRPVALGACPRRVFGKSWCAALGRNYRTSFMKRNCRQSSALPQLRMSLNCHHTITHDSSRHLSTSHDVPNFKMPTSCPTQLSDVISLCCKLRQAWRSTNGRSCLSARECLALLPANRKRWIFRSESQ